MIVAKFRIVPRLVVASLLVATLGLQAYAVDLTWTGASSSLIFDNGNATGNWNPSVPTGVQGADENWIFPDAATLGAGSTTPSFDSGGILTVGGPSLGGVTFLTGAPAYTFTQTDVANTLNLAGSTNDNTSSDRGIITNNSANTQTFNMDVISTRGTIDAASGDIVFSAGHTFTTGGPADLDPGGNTNANTFSTIFQGDHNIYLNSNVVQTETGFRGTNGQRGLLRYRGASTPDSPASAGALILGDLGAFGGRIVVDSTNGGVVRATHSNSFGVYGGTTQSGTFVGNGSATVGNTTNATVELDGSAGNITTQESFYLGMRAPDNQVSLLRNVAGNNTITGFTSLNSPTKANLDAFNSAYFESLAGKLTFQGSISNDRTAAGFPNTTLLYFKGNGDFELGGGVDGGIYNNDPSTFVLNVDKTGDGTVTLVSTGNPVSNWAGTTTIHAGAWIVNGTHTTANAAAYAIETNGKLGGSGTIGSTVNLSGSIAPGEAASVGTFTVGGLTTTGGILDFQLDTTNHTAGSTFNDLLVISNDGTLDLTGGATLNVTGIGGNLTVGDYDLIQFGGTTTPVGTAANIALGTIPLGAGLAASIVFDADSVNLHIAAGLPGDYNGDNKVDAADYVVWRKGGSPDSTVAGYNLWRANFGNPPGSGSAAGSGLGSSQSVPEPTTLALVGLLASLLIVKWRSRG